MPSFRGGGRDAVPPNGCLCPHFVLLKILFLEHHAMTRQQIVMEKIAVHKSDAILRR